MIENAHDKWLKAKTLEERFVIFAVDAYASGWSIAFHVLLWAYWLNTGLQFFHRPIDPHPFFELTLLVSLEGVLGNIFLSLYQKILSHQGELQKHADYAARLHLSDQIAEIKKLLTEKDAYEG